MKIIADLVYYPNGRVAVTYRDHAGSFLGGAVRKNYDVAIERMPQDLVTIRRGNKVRR